MKDKKLLEVTSCLQCGEYNNKENKQCPATMEIKVNDLFVNKVNNEIYVIKGAWDDRYPDNDHAFLMKKSGEGRAYSGRVTKVNSVWSISESEFRNMCGSQRGNFEKYKLIEDTKEVLFSESLLHRKKSDYLILEGRLDGLQNCINKLMKHLGVREQF